MENFNIETILSSEELRDIRTPLRKPEKLSHRKNYRLSDQDLACLDIIQDHFRSLGLRCTEAEALRYAIRTCAEAHINPEPPLSPGDSPCFSRDNTER